MIPFGRRAAAIRARACNRPDIGRRQVVRDPIASRSLVGVADETLKVARLGIPRRPPPGAIKREACTVLGTEPPSLLSDSLRPPFHVGSPGCNAWHQAVSGSWSGSTRRLRHEGQPWVSGSTWPQSSISGTPDIARSTASIRSGLQVRPSRVFRRWCSPHIGAQLSSVERDFMPSPPDARMWSGSSCPEHSPGIPTTAPRQRFRWSRLASSTTAGSQRVPRLLAIGAYLRRPLTRRVRAAPSQPPGTPRQPRPRCRRGPAPSRPDRRTSARRSGRR